VSNTDELFAKFGREFKKDEVLFKDGDMSREMYIIQSGRIEITKKVRDVEKRLVVLGAGDFFGEMATLNNKPRSANAIVHEDSELLVIDPDTFESMITNSNEVALRMIKKLAERVQETDDLIEDLLLKDKNSKVVTALIRYAYDFGTEESGGIKVSISLSKLTAQVDVDKAKVKEVIIDLVRRRIVKVVPDGLIITSLDSITKYLNYLTQKEKLKKNDTF